MFDDDDIWFALGNMILGICLFVFIGTAVLAAASLFT